MISTRATSFHSLLRSLVITNMINKRASLFFSLIVLLYIRPIRPLVVTNMTNTRANLFLSLLVLLRIRLLNVTNMINKRVSLFSSLLVLYYIRPLVVKNMINKKASLFFSLLVLYYIRSQFATNMISTRTNLFFSLLVLWTRGVSSGGGEIPEDVSSGESFFEMIMEKLNAIEIDITNIESSIQSHGSGVESHIQVMNSPCNLYKIS